MRRVPLACLGVTVIALGAILARSPALGLGPPLLLRNDGASMPLGWYRFVHAGSPKVGDVVVLRDPPHFALSWLMKRVEGVGGSFYCWRADIGTHELDSRVMPSPLPAAVARGLPVWKGCRHLAADEVVGYGESTDSYDARYFGPVATETLWGVYALTWPRQTRSAGSPAPP